METIKARKFSVSQEQAITTTGNNLLVSASAGSGKTTVLVERVIRKILAGESIAHLLILTFTEAAAKEMKERIKVALEAKLSTSDLDYNLKRNFQKQLQDLPLANISTFHAFCLTIIRRFFYLIDLDLNFRLLSDEAEIELLQEEVITELLEAELTTNKEATVAVLKEFASDKSTDGLKDVILKTYDFARVSPDPATWLSNLVKIYQVDDDQTLAETEVYQNYFRPFLQQVVAQLQQKVTDFSHQAELLNHAKLLEIAEFMTNLTTNLAKALSTNDLETWDNLLTETKFPRYSFSKKDEAYEELQALKADFVEIKDLFQTDLSQASNFLGSKSYHLEILRKAEPIITTLADLTSKFLANYQQKKAEQHLLDFSDLEHFALEILRVHNDHDQSVAQEYYQNKFNEVLVDEYQDVNSLQVEIINLVARNNNRFLVGDVKQSIYGFRLADPTQFITIYDRYQEQKDGELIILAENYRSRSEILNFTNLIFKQIMDTTVGQITYDDEAILKVGNHQYPTEAMTPEILLFDTQDIEEQEIDQLDKNTGQITMVARLISQILHEQTLIWDSHQHRNRPVTLADFAILTATKSNNLAIQEIFASFNLPTNIADVNTYFQTTEIQTILSLLKLIDNPKQDIPLAAVLRSPLVGLKEEELAQIRLLNQEAEFHQAVTLIDDHFPKTKKFLVQLDQWRTLAPRISLADLIWNIYYTTAYLDYVGAEPNGRVRQANLYALVEKAVEFESKNLRGLYQFVRFIQKIQEKDYDLAEEITTSKTVAIEVMTIHKSKGLEFPIVFVLNLEKKFNQQDLTENILLDEKLGLGINFLDHQTRLVYETIPLILIRQEKKKKLLSEEYRKLYVALTRAEQKLFLVGSVADFAKSLEKWANNATSEELVLNSSWRLKTNNFLDLVMTALLRHRDADQFNHEYLVGNLPEIKNDPATFKLTVVDSADLARQDQQLDQLSRVNPDETLQDYATEIKTAINRLNFAYPHQIATETATYQSVTELKRSLETLETDEDLSVLLPNDDLKPAVNRYVVDHLKKPQFLMGQEETEVKATDLGTAVHLLMQTVDLSRIPTITTFKKLLADFVATNIIAEPVARKINLAKLVEFWHGEFGQFICQNHQFLHREEPFSMLISAHSIYQNYPNNNDQILVHAIIDGYLEFEQELTLFDYKTDRLNSNNLEQSIKKLINKYQGQLLLYSEALQATTRKKVSSTKIVFLQKNIVVEVKDWKKEKALH